MLISRTDSRVLSFVILGFWTTMKSKSTGGCKRCTFQIGLIQQKYFPFPISWSWYWQKIFLNKNSAISGSRIWLWLCEEKLSLTLWSERASSGWLKFRQTVGTTLIICLFISLMFHLEAASRLPHGWVPTIYHRNFADLFSFQLRGAHCIFQASDQFARERFIKVKVFWIDIVDCFVIFVAVLNKDFYSEILAEKNL